MKKTFLFLLFITVPLFAAQDQKNLNNFEINFKGQTKDGKFKTLDIFLFEVEADKKTLIEELHESSKFKFSFKYNKDYLIRFEKIGYISKELSVSTKNISLKRWKREFCVVHSVIELSEKTINDSTENFLATGSFYYSDSLGDFNFRPNPNIK